MTTQRYLLTCTAIVLAFALAGCGMQTSEAAGATPVATTEIRVMDNNFDPPAAEVAVGDTVTWTWEGSADHNVEGDGFASEVQRAGTFAHRFDSAGTYDYRCTLHPGMTGRVVVGGGAAGGR